VKLNLNLSLPPNPAQRRAQSLSAGQQLARTRAHCAAHWPATKSYTGWATANRKPVRIPPPVINAQPVLRGDKAYLRALRAAEMAAWNASLAAIAA